MSLGRHVDRKIVLLAGGILLASAGGSYAWVASRRPPRQRLAPIPSQQSVYNKIAPTYDSKVGLDECFFFLPLLRRQLVNKVYGKVLEVGAGTGRNFKYMPWKQISHITFLDESKGMLSVLQEKLGRYAKIHADVDFTVQCGTPEMFEGQKYDSILQTFALCSMERPLVHLNTLISLLKPNGKLFLMEHGQSYYEIINRTLRAGRDDHRADWGCDWSKDIEAIVDACDGQIKSMKRWHFGTTYIITIEKGVY